MSKPEVRLKNVHLENGNRLVGTLVDPHPVLGGPWPEGDPRNEIRSSRVLKIETRNTVYVIDYGDNPNK